MKVQPIHKLYLLRVLRASGAAPMAEVNLRSGLRTAFPGQRFTEADITDAIRSLETDDLIKGTTDRLLEECFWTLTQAGSIRASEL